jgi:hypothetical protein
MRDFLRTLVAGSRRQYLRRDRRLRLIFLHAHAGFQFGFGSIDVEARLGRKWLDAADRGLPEMNAIAFARNLIPPVQPHFQKNSASCLTQIKSITRAVSSPAGAYRDRHGRGMGCGGRGSVGRAM